MLLLFFFKNIRHRIFNICGVRCRRLYIKKIFFVFHDSSKCFFNVSLALNNKTLMAPTLH